MNGRILQKCVEELKKDSFSKEYVLGMLETLIEMQAPHETVTYSYSPTVPVGVPAFTQAPQPEERTDIEAAYNRGGIGKI